MLRWPVRLLRITTVLAVSMGLALGVSTAYGRTLESWSTSLPLNERQLLQQVNAIRASASCPQVTVDPALVGAAQAQADDMVTRGFLSSVNPDNEDPAARVRVFGYSGKVTESYAAGLGSPSEVADQWINPENPYAKRVTDRIVDCRMVSGGIGHNTGTPLPGLAAHVWVLVLGDK